MDKGVLRTADSDSFAGVGIRALVDGAWGFASTSKLDKTTLNETTEDAITAAKTLSSHTTEKTVLAPIEPVEGAFTNLGKDPLSNHGFEHRIVGGHSLGELS